MREYVTTELRNKSFAMRMVNGRNKLPEEVVEVGDRNESLSCTQDSYFYYRNRRGILPSCSRSIV